MKTNARIKLITKKMAAITFVFMAAIAVFATPAISAAAEIKPSDDSNLVQKNDGTGQFGTEGQIVAPGIACESGNCLGFMAPGTFNDSVQFPAPATADASGKSGAKPKTEKVGK